MNKLVWGAVAATSAIIGAGPATAAFVGVTLEDVNVNGVLYDVAFFDGRLDALFPGPVPAFDFTTGVTALAAADAIVARSEFQTLAAPYIGFGVFVPFAVASASSYEVAWARGASSRGYYVADISYNWADPTSSFLHADFTVVPVEDPGPVTAPVPEPAAWALMILGFGAAGGMLRRRRTALA